MENEVQGMVRTLGVRAAQAHIWRDNLGENALTLIVGAHAHAKDDWHTIRCHRRSFVAAPSEINGKMYSRRTGMRSLHCTSCARTWAPRPRSKPARPGCARRV